MSSNSLSLTPAGNWQGGNEHEDSSPDQDPHQNRRTSVPFPLRYCQGDERGRFAPWRLFQERVRTGPYGLTRFPSAPHSPVQILVITSGAPTERLSPRLRNFVQNSPLRSRGEWLHEPEVPAGLTDEQFKNAMKKMRKQVYNVSNKKAMKKGLFRNWSNKAEEVEVYKGEEKVCPVCLEMFKSSDKMLVTPCNHMFHHDCLVPWVKSNGHCPVCRLAFCERGVLAMAIPLSNNGYNVGDEKLQPVDLLSLIRAMEEALNWVSLSG